MSNETAKFINSRRRHKNDVAVARQVKIAKQHHIAGYKSRDEKEPHRMAKRHAMDCGNSDCAMCSSPRKVTGDKTKQEKSFEQTGKWVEE